MKKVYDDANEYFEEMKKETEEKRLEREAAWADRELSEREKAERAEQRSAKRFCFTIYLSVIIGLMACCGAYLKGGGEGGLA